MKTHHDYLFIQILCQNRIFSISDPKTYPRLNTAEVTFVTYHCKDLKEVIWIGLLVVPKKISCLVPLFCIVIRNKERNCKYFGMLTDFHIPTPQFLNSKYPEPYCITAATLVFLLSLCETKIFFILIDTNNCGRGGGNDYGIPRAWWDSPFWKFWG